jgi:hypothetical protein
MIGVKKITITRAEGPMPGVHVGPDGRLVGFPEATVSGWVEAAGVLARWSTTAPKGGAYDKCDFKITFEDGETYEGTYDLKHFSEERASLKDHVRKFVGCYSTLLRPPWTYREGKEHYWEEMKERFIEDGTAGMMYWLASYYDVGLEREVEAELEDMRQRGVA